MWRGTWLEAEQELTAATDELAASRPAMTADGLVRLAELRRRQGRLVEAAALFEQAEPHGLALLGRAELAFDRGDRGRRPSRRRATCAASRRTTGRIAPPASSCWCARWSRRAISTARAPRSPSSRPSRRSSTTRPLRRSASLAAGCVALGAGDAGRRAAALRGRRRSIPAERRAVRGGARANRAGARAGRSRTRATRPREEAQRAIDLLAELKAELEMVARARRCSTRCAHQRRRGGRRRRHGGLTTREIEVFARRRRA